MRILDADATSMLVNRIVHLDTQRAPTGLDLSVGSVHRVTGPGALDFGGSEFQPAAREELEPELANPDDDYGWWRLDAGTYVMRYNESLALQPGQLAHVLPLERLLRAGASHPAFVVDDARDPLESLLTVGGSGCRMKENCRVSRLLVLDGIQGERR